MASTRELWIVLRARDEASRVISTFSKNVRAAALRAQAAAKTQEAQRLRQIAIEQRWNSQLAQNANSWRLEAARLENLAAATAVHAQNQKDARDALIQTNRLTQSNIDAINSKIKATEAEAKALRASAREAASRSALFRAQNDEIVRGIEGNARAFDREAASLRRAAQEAETHDLKMRALNQTIARVSEVATVGAFAFGALGIAGVAAMKNSIDAAVEYERQVRATATQVDGFGGNLEELGAIGMRIANEIGISFDQIQPALFDIFSSMEVNVKDAERLLNSFAKAAVAGQTDIQAVSRATIGLLNAFHRPASDVNKILDIQFQLIQEGIGTYEEWNQRIGLVTPSAVRAGQSIEIMAAALATATRMGLSAARSGTSVARAMDAMSHPTAVKNMEELGVKVRDAHGRFLPMNETLRSFRDILNKIPEKNRVATILEVFKGAGGTIEARRFIQNILLGKNNLELFDEVLAEVTNSAGSMDKAYSTMADSVAVKTELLRNKWNILKITLGEALMPQFSALIDGVQRVLDWFNQLPSGTKNVITQFILWGSVISIATGLLLGLVAVISVLVAALVTIGTTGSIIIGVFAAIPVAIAALIGGFVLAYKKSEEFRNGVGNVISTLKTLWGIITDTGAQIRDIFDREVVPAFNRLKDAFQKNILPIIQDVATKVKEEFIPKFQEAARIVRDEIGAAFIFVKDRIDKDLIPALQTAKEWWGENKDQILPFVTGLAQLAKWLIIIGGALVAGVIGAFGLLASTIGILINVFKFLWDAGQAVVNFFIMLWGWVQQIPGLFMTAVTAVGNFVMSVLNWFQELPGRALAFVQQLPQRLWNLFTDMLSTGAYILGYGFGLIIKFFAELPGKAMNAINSLKEKVGQFFINVWNTGRSNTARGVEAVLSFFRNLPNRAWNAAVSLIDKLGDLIKRAGDAMKNRGKAAVDNLIDTVKSLPRRINDFTGQMWSAGWDLIMGMLRGIRSAAGNLRQAAIDAVKSAIQGAKDALKIGSPSKVFFDIGVFTVQGMINGLDRMAKPLYNTMNDIAGGMPNELNMNANTGFRNSALGGGQNNNNGSTGSTTNQYITIHTNEIDPRLTAAQLGFELQNRM